MATLGDYLNNQTPTKAATKSAPAPSTSGKKKLGDYYQINAQSYENSAPPVSNNAPPQNQSLWNKIKSLATKAGQYTDKEVSFAVHHPIQAVANLSGQSNQAENLGTLLSEPSVRRSNEQLAQSNQQAIDRLMQQRRTASVGQKARIDKTIDTIRNSSLSATAEDANNPTLNKTPLQVVGDTTQSVLGLAPFVGGLAGAGAREGATVAGEVAPSILKRNLIPNQLRELLAPNSVRQAEGLMAKLGAIAGNVTKAGLAAAPLGVPFGVAGGLSAGQTKPGELAISGAKGAGQFAALGAAGRLVGEGVTLKGNLKAPVSELKTDQNAFLRPNEGKPEPTISRPTPGNQEPVVSTPTAKTSINDLPLATEDNAGGIVTKTEPTTVYNGANKKPVSENRSTAQVYANQTRGKKYEITPEQQLADETAKLNEQRQTEAMAAIPEQKPRIKPADELRTALKEHADNQQLQHETAQQQYDLANQRLEGNLDNIKRLINAEERRKTGMDVTKIRGLDVATQNLRDAMGNPELTVNDAVDYIKAVPTKSEIAKLKPAVIKEPTPTGEKVVKKTPSKPAEPIGMGKERLSRAYQRVKDTVIASEGEPTYHQMNLETNAKNAVDRATTNFDNSVAIIRGEKPLPRNVTYNALASATADEAASRGNFGLQAEIERKRTLALTRGGQEIASNIGIGNDTPSGAIDTLLKDRMEAAQKKVGGRTTAKLIDEGVRETSSIVRKMTPKIEDLRSFVNGLRC